MINKKTYKVELITNKCHCTMVEIEAFKLEKLDYHTIEIDGVKWTVPCELGMSFAEIICDDEV